MFSSNFESALSRFDAIDAVCGGETVETLREILSPLSLESNLRLVAAIAWVSVDLLTDEQFREAAGVAIAEALAAAAVYGAWDGGRGEIPDGIAAMRDCREAGKCLAEVAARLSSKQSDK